MGYNTASVWIKVAFFCLLISLVLFVIGFATISWMNNEHYDYYGYGYSDDWGLWRRKTCRAREWCTSHKLDKYSLVYYAIEDSHRAVQAFESMGLISLGLAVLIILLFVFMDSIRRRSPLIAIIVFTFAAVLFMVIGFIVMAFQFDYDIHGHQLSPLSPGWSMWVAVAACAFAFIAGVMCVIDLSQQAHDVIIPSDRRRCDVITSHRR